MLEHGSIGMQNWPAPRGNIAQEDGLLEGAQRAQQADRPQLRHLCVRLRLQPPDHLQGSAAILASAIFRSLVGLAFRVWNIKFPNS